MVVLQQKNQEFINNVKKTFNSKFKNKFSKLISFPKILHKVRVCLKLFKSASEKVSPQPEWALDTDTQVRAILLSRASCTLSEFKTDYEDLVGDELLPNTKEGIRDLLLTVPGVTVQKSKLGTEFWHVSSEKSAHITDMIKRQRRHRTKRPRTETLKHEDVVPPKRSRIERQNVASAKPRKQRQLGFYYNYQLMGDDFFLCVAKMELGYGMHRDPETRVLSVGSCVSGMTIKDACELARSNAVIDSNLIICLGYADIMNGKSIDVIKTDLLDMMAAFFGRGIEPAICTLPPLTFSVDDPTLQHRINEFNNFLLGQNHWRIIDLSKQFIREGQMIKSYYQPKERKMSGCQQKLTLWNTLGRKAVCRELKKYIATCY